MKKIILLFLLATPFLLSSQNSISETCSTENTNGTVVDFESFNGSVYATGFFTQICGMPTSHIAKWENSEWLPVDIPLPDPGHSLRSIGSQLFIAKYEENIDSNWVYVYDGTNLEKFGTGVYLTTASGFSELPNIYDVVEFNNSIIACGEFDKVGSQAISGIMQWNNNQWEDMAGGLSGNIPNTAPVMYPHQMLVHNSELYIVGNFRKAGSVVVNGIAKWDGNQWSAMGAGFNSTVYGIGIYNNEIYVGGDFTKSGTTDIKRIAKWDGNQWVSPGFGFVPLNANDYSFVHTIVEVDNTLLIAGGLKKIAYDNGMTADCGGIIGYSTNGIDNFEGGVADNDIEAVIATADGKNLLFGGGVFGNGYLGVLNIINHSRELFHSDINIFPNPFSDQINIKSSEIILEVSISDIHGKTVWDQKEGLGSPINLGQLNNGLYYLLAKTKSGVVVEKIIKY